MNILILTPVFDGKPHDAYCQGLAETFRCYGADVERYSFKGCADVSLARNTLLARARANSKWDALVWIDADIGFGPNDVSLVAAPIAMKQASLVCGIYPKKQFGPLVYPVLFHEDDVSESQGYVGPTHDFSGEDYGRLLSAGMGFVAMSRAAVEAAADVVPDYCPTAGLSLTNALDERHALVFQPTVQIDRRQSLHRFYGEDATGLGILRDQGRVLEGTENELLFAKRTKLSHHTSEFSFGGQIPDLFTTARLAAFGNDVMRRASAGEAVSPDEIMRRQNQILAAAHLRTAMDLRAAIPTR